MHTYTQNVTSDMSVCDSSGHQMEADSWWDSSTSLHLSSKLKASHDFKSLDFKIVLLWFHAVSNLVFNSFCYSHLGHGAAQPLPSMDVSKGRVRWWM